MKAARKKSRYKWLRQAFLIKQLGQKLSTLIEAKTRQKGFLRRLLESAPNDPVFEIVP